MKIKKWNEFNLINESVNPYYGSYDIKNLDVSLLKEKLESQKIDYNYNENKNIISVNTSNPLLILNILKEFNCDKKIGSKNENILTISAKFSPNVPKGAYL